MFSRHVSERRGGRISPWPLEPWLQTKLGLISQRTKLAESIRYALSPLGRTDRFLEEGRIEIDSNIVEGPIRPIAMNRQNALFAGSDGGGEHWAVIASLIETCKLCNIEPRNYLTSGLTKKPALFLPKCMPLIGGIKFGKALPVPRWRSAQARRLRAHRSGDGRAPSRTQVGRLRARRVHD